MIHFTMALAGVAIGVSVQYPSTERFCREYLTDAAPSVSVAVTQADIDAERVRAACQAAREGRGEPRYSDAYLETLALYRALAKPLLAQDALIFHGAVLALEGRAYLFTAPSGTGKTTHSRLWLEHIPGTHVLNGDKPVLKLTAEGAFACGTPWQGKENYGCNEMLPLEAICVLERGEENRIEPVTFSQAMTALIRQTHQPQEPELRLKTLSLLGRLGTGVRLYRMGCTMEPEAAMVSFRAMRAEKA
ncbi:MAG: hypothetical protein IJS53_00890 [Clostridia bacterium]|nr:hypothetical protein [Clostridia bacterium]